MSRKANLKNVSEKCDVISSGPNARNRFNQLKALMSLAFLTTFVYM
jgi:hypothetical protein